MDSTGPTVTTINWSFKQDRDALVEATPGKLGGMPGSGGPVAVSALEGCYSIKSGVVWVGKVNQGSKSLGEKGILEKESLLPRCGANTLPATTHSQIATI